MYNERDSVVYKMYCAISYQYIKKDKINKSCCFSLHMSSHKGLFVEKRNDLKDIFQDRR